MPYSATSAGPPVAVTSAGFWSGLVMILISAVVVLGLIHSLRSGNMLSGWSKTGVVKREDSDAFWLRWFT